MFKTYLFAALLTCVAAGAMAQENLVPRTIPLSDDKPKAAPAPKVIVRQNPVPAPAPSDSSVGQPSFSSGEGPGPRYSSSARIMEEDNPLSRGPSPEERRGQRAEAQQIKNQVNEDRLNDTFNEADTNGDGLVNEAEFSMYYKTKPDAPEFVRYDQNNDGQITRQEYLAGNVIGQTILPPREPENSR